MDESSDASRTVAEQVSDDLRDAFVVLHTASVPAEQRATLHRRLLAITTTAKRDVHRAREQLVRFFDDIRTADAASNAHED